ncbi:MAG: hypothetical protein ACTSPV_12855, partial [Candidatus Hodarchaeales archaeon]
MTRQKLGRRKFIVFVFAFVTVENIILLILGFLWGFGPTLTPELAMMNSFYAVIGTTGLAIIIEIISNLNDNFIQNLLLKKIVIGDTTELRSKAINFVWSSKIYYVVIVTYVIVNIGNIFYFLTGKITIYHMFFGGIVGLTVTLTLYGEFFWLVFSPTIIILYLPKLGLKLDVFDCDMAGGLSP